MKLYSKLPEEIRSKIYYYALPKMDKKLKRSIEVTSAHHCIQRMDNIWSKPYFDENRQRMHPPFSWEEMIYKNTNKEKREQLIIALSNCGCCERHSCGIYDKPHCLQITGSQTIKKRDKKYTFYGKSCNCWCRFQIRFLKNIDNR